MKKEGIKKQLSFYLSLARCLASKFPISVLVHKQVFKYYVSNFSGFGTPPHFVSVSASQDPPPPLHRTTCCSVILSSYLHASHIKIAMSTNMRMANMKNSEALLSKALASATIMTMMLPNATVRSQAACRTDFMLSGAWL